MILLRDLTLRIAGRPLLEGANAQLPDGQRYGVIGRNGTGKTTLLKLFAGTMQPDGGELVMPRMASIGTIAQEAPGGAQTPLEAVLRADAERTTLLAEAEEATDPYRIAEIQTRLVDIDAHSAEARAARILKGLGFDETAQATRLDAFSGGWRMRVALAALLFVEPDILLLDEPTNHLDLEAALWLEEHLRRYPRTLILVSHDRDLLNSIPQQILHLSGRKLTLYTGNYDSFDRQRRERIALERKLQEKQEARRKHLQSFVDRFRYKASKARQAQSRLKMIAKMPTIGATVIEPEIAFRFPQPEMPPPPLVTFDRVDVGYDGEPVLCGINQRIDPDDRIALLGANGNGKSTFAKLVAGRLEPMAGEVTRARKLEVGFFAQHQIEDLEPGASPLDHLRERLRGTRDQDLRARLARFGLSADQVDTPARSLSGGEKTRLALCLMCLGRPQLLILDEPTNHLDIDSREALVEALNDYPGAVIVVSHDRSLIELTCDRLWLVAHGRVQTYDEDIETYRRWLLSGGAQEKAATAATPAAPASSDSGTPSKRPPPAERRGRLAPLREAARETEKTLARLEKEKAAVDRELADSATYADSARAAELAKRVETLADEIARTEERWLELQSEIEALA